MVRFVLLLTCLVPLSLTGALHEVHANELADTLRMNQIQVIGSHNSFKAQIDPTLYDIILAVRSDAVSLDYAHPPLTEQLNLGLRGLELDLFHDPEGGRYANPMGAALVKELGKEPMPHDPEGKMLKPGFKVMHIQDIDFRSNCLTLVDALTEIRDWSDKHPRHLPIVITFNLSDSKIEIPGSVEPKPFNKEALDSLDVAFLEVLGKEKIITPDDVRGDHKTLEAAVLDSGWPTLADARGRILLVIDHTGRKKATYLVDHPGLKGRVMFVDSKPGEDEAAVMIRNNPVKEEKLIAKLVKQGYLIRTRADSGLREARKGDYRRFEAAQRSGAQVISTDFFQTTPHIHPDFQIRFSDKGYTRLNPLTDEIHVKGQSR